MYETILTGKRIWLRKSLEQAVCMLFASSIYELGPLRKEDLQPAGPDNHQRFGGCAVCACGRHCKRFASC